jgi:cytidylate kinase
VQIAIDGPVAAGKGTVAKSVAKKLKFLYVDTGGMYRALALLVDQAGVNCEEEKEIAKLLKIRQPKVDLKQPDRVLLDKEDVSDLIRTERMSYVVSVITQYKSIRDYLVPQQRRIGEEQNVVMEGRDIGSVVLSKADLKIYLTADSEARAKRRWLQLDKRVPYKEVLAKLEERDKRDSGRELSPLKKVADAVEVDTTNLTIEQMIETILELWKKRKK